MDEKELEELFRAAPGEPPPPGFGLAEVTGASARAAARRRQLVLLVATCLVVLVGTAGVVGLTYFRSNGTSAAQPALAPARPPDILTTPSASQGTGGNGEDGPRAESTSGCDKVDRELATALAGELPATGVTGPYPGRGCVAGARSAMFHVPGGSISAALIPHGVEYRLDQVPGQVVASQLAQVSSGTIVVVSVPDAGSTAPLSEQLTRIATGLAARF
ncbi:hypothetical protein [Amycolatopsis sp.]|uniref:hypothetical protein n=1 Tax=Amycolatopsis sp. TaxID=37632 RepID=UPI002CC30A7C|nr:hypothetical protein [Amycolatopsis sp.]HVV09633.1 hypothetical protein [Amycolatopsis sp.]